MDARSGGAATVSYTHLVSVARADFIRERTLLRGTAGWLQIAAGQPEDVYKRQGLTYRDASGKYWTLEQLPPGRKMQASPFLPEEERCV